MTEEINEEEALLLQAMDQIIGALQPILPQNDALRIGIDQDISMGQAVKAHKIDAHGNQFLGHRLGNLMRRAGTAKGNIDSKQTKYRAILKDKFLALGSNIAVLSCRWIV